MYSNFDKDAFSRGVWGGVSLVEETACTFFLAHRFRMRNEKFLIFHPNEIKLIDSIP